MRRSYLLFGLSLTLVLILSACAAARATPSSDVQPTRSPTGQQADSTDGKSAPSPDTDFRSMTSDRQTDSAENQPAQSSGQATVSFFVPSVT